MTNDIVTYAMSLYSHVPRVEISDGIFHVVGEVSVPYPGEFAVRGTPDVSIGSYSNSSGLLFDFTVDRRGLAPVVVRNGTMGANTRILLSPEAGFQLTHTNRFALYAAPEGKTLTAATPTSTKPNPKLWTLGKFSGEQRRGATLVIPLESSAFRGKGENERLIFDFTSIDGYKGAAANAVTTNALVTAVEMDWAKTGLIFLVH